MQKLLGYSWIAGLVLIGVVVIALSFLYRRLVFESLIEGETHSNVAVTQLFANSIWPKPGCTLSRSK